MEFTKDYLTGDEIPLTGAEENRQKVIEFLVEQKGYSKSEIKRKISFELIIEEEIYKTELDLAIVIDQKYCMAFKTPAGSLASWDREIIAAARIFIKDYQIPFAIVTNGENAEIFDSVKGKKISNGMDKIPSRQDIEKYISENSFVKFPEEKIERQKMVFRTYDTLNVNR
jgi:predicted polyphosphate/ATP-dependent NAD kinase